MKKLLVFLLINVILGVGYWHYKLSNVIERVRPSVVLIQAWNKSGAKCIGSGMVLENGLILTARHVIADANNVCVRFEDGSKIRSSEFFVVKTIDAGLIIIKDFDGGYPKDFVSRLCFPNIGDTVFAIGSPFGKQNSVTVGIFSAYDRDIKGERLHQLDINGAPGMSGCPVFNRYGSVIGMITRGNSHGMIFIVPSETCKFMVAVYENVEKAKTK